jgi:hypothetical protein
MKKRIKTYTNDSNFIVCIYQVAVDRYEVWVEDTIGSIDDDMVGTEITLERAIKLAKCANQEYFFD